MPRGRPDNDGGPGANGRPTPDQTEALVAQTVNRHKLLRSGSVLALGDNDLVRSLEKHGVEVHQATDLANHMGSYDWVVTEYVTDEQIPACYKLARNVVHFGLESDAHRDPNAWWISVKGQVAPRTRSA